MSTTDACTMSYDEWVDRGVELFGHDRFDWKFVCPSCGNVQCPRDFEPYKDRGVTPDTAYFNCIGRYDGHMDVDICSGKSPCNYASGGLFNLNKLRVIGLDGKEHRIFKFAEPT